MDRSLINKFYISAKAKDYVLLILSITIITYIHLSVPDTFHFIHILHYYLYYLVVIYASVKIGFLGGLLSALVTSILYDYEIYKYIFTLPHYKLRSFIEVMMLYTVAFFTGFFSQKFFIEKLKLEEAKEKLSKLLEELQNSIEEKMKIEKELARIDRLRLMGEIGASIAHEVRNPLSSIKSAAKFIKENGNVDELLDIILKESEQLESFISRFTHFFRKSEMVFEKIYISDIIEDLKDYIRMYLKNKNVAYYVENKSNIEYITTDKIAIKHILLNFIINAFEAVEDIDNGKVLIKIYNDLNYIYFAVKDNGKGVQEEEKNRIFEPFYSTKKKGTGLGLSISLKIASEIGGTILVENDNGAKFILRLPL